MVFLWWGSVELKVSSDLQTNRRGPGDAGMKYLSRVIVVLQLHSKSDTKCNHQGAPTGSVRDTRALLLMKPEVLSWIRGAVSKLRVLVGGPGGDLLTLEWKHQKSINECRGNTEVQHALIKIQLRVYS